MASGKYRSYVFTVQNYTDEDILRLDSLDVKYLIYGKEIAPTTGTPHLQGYVTWPNPLARKGSTKRLGGCWNQPANGTPEQNQQYCSKEGRDVTERGHYNPGGRSDLDLVKDIIKEGGGMRKIVDVTTSYQGIKMAEVLLKYKEKQRDWKPEVHWFYGPTGTGKTREAIKILGDDCYVAMSTMKWMEGYDAHENVLIDDMRKDFCKFHELLRLLDRYGMRVECKGGSRQFLAKKIIITSCFSPQDMWTNNMGEQREDIGQLLRRIDKVTRFGESIF